MNKLIINNDISKLSLESKSINKILWEALRFRDKNAIFNPAFRRRNRGGWDGFVDFYSIKTGKFGTGILPEVVKALFKLQIKAIITDNRSNLISFNKVTKKTLEDINLRDYQVNIANKAWEVERGIIKAPTGSGKTLLFCSIIKSIPENTPTLILFRSKTLVNQTYNVLKKNGIKNIGRVHGEVWEPNIIMCSTIQSVHKYEELLSKFKVLIVDECHQFASKKSINVFKKLKQCRYRLGFSATPWSKGNIIQEYTLKSWFGPVIGNISTKELQDKDILSSSICYFHEIHKPENINHLNYQEAYDQGVILNDIMHQMIKKIVDSYSSGRILIVVERIEHGERLLINIPEAIWIKGEDKSDIREETIEKLCKSDPNEKVVVIATRIIQTGIDMFVHAVINAAGFKSDIMTIQRLGRGLRKAPDKKILDYHDFMFDTNRYLEKHSKERIKHLKKEGHTIKIIRSA